MMGVTKCRPCCSGVKVNSSKIRWHKVAAHHHRVWGFESTVVQLTLSSVYEHDWSCVQGRVIFVITTHESTPTGLTGR